MFPSKLGAIVLDVFGLLTVATIIFGDPGVGLATGTFSGYDDIDYLSKIVPGVDNEQTFPSFGADPARQRSRRVADYHNLGGYPHTEHEPVEAKHESNAWSPMNPSITHYIGQPVQSGHPNPSQESVDFFHNFAMYYGDVDQQNGDGYEILYPRVYGMEDEYIPGEGYEDVKEEAGDASNKGLSESAESEEDSESMGNEEPRGHEDEEESTHPKNLLLIEQQLQDLIHQISSLYTLVHRNPYLAPVLTPYLYSNLPLPLPAPLYSPQAAPVPLGKQLINFSRGPSPASFAVRPAKSSMNPVNYPAWPSNFPVSPANYPIGSANYPASPVTVNDPVRQGNYPGSPVNYQAPPPPVNYHGLLVRPNYRVPGRPVNYPHPHQAKAVVKPQQQMIPLQVRFH